MDNPPSLDVIYDHSKARPGRRGRHPGTYLHSLRWRPFPVWNPFLVWNPFSYLELPSDQTGTTTIFFLIDSVRASPVRSPAWLRPYGAGNGGIAATARMDLAP